MSYELKAELRFITKSEEQAEYIRSLLNDLQALIICESSYMTAEEIQETSRV